MYIYLKWFNWFYSERYFFVIFYKNKKTTKYLSLCYGFDSKLCIPVFGTNNKQ